MIVLTTFVSLVIGEIVPKQIALRSPEPIAVIMSRPMRWLSMITAPFVWLLDRSSALIFRLFGLDRESKNQVTAEELHLVVAEAQTAGVLEERRAGDDLGHRAARRPPGARSHDSAHRDRLDRCRRDRRARSAQALLETPHSRIPVADGSVENIVGVIQIRDVLAGAARGPAARPQALVPQGAGDSRPDGRDGRACRAAQRRRAAGARPRRIWPSRRDRHARQHPRRACRHLRPRRRAGRGAAAGRARGRQLAGVGRGERRPARRPARRRPARTTAIIRPSPASLCRCSSICPKPAKDSATTAGRSRSSTWTGARSTS